MTKIICKGEKIPVTKYKYFTTEEQNQTEVIIKIYQGERCFIKDNISIGNFKLKNIATKNKGEVIIKIEISVDNNGIINVKANERGSSNNNSIIIENNNLINDDKLISKLISEAEKFSNLDNCKHKLREKYFILQGQIENLKFNCNNNIYINLKDEEKKDITEHIDKLEKKIDSNIEPVRFIFDNNIEYKNIDVGHFELIINNFRKLIKVNEKRYPSIILSFDKNCESYDKSQNLSIVDNEIENEFKHNIKNYIQNIYTSIEKDLNISKYSKKIIFSFVNNLNYKLESIKLDQDLYDENLEKLNVVIKQIIENDDFIINKYGKIYILKKIISEYNINVQITQEMTNIDYFNLIEEISTENNINIDNLL